MSDEDPRPGTRPLSETVLATLGIDLVEATGERVVLHLEVGPQVHQPYGYLHGGVSVLLAETAASVGASIAAGPDKRVLGMEINANHMRTVRDGKVITVGTPIHQGRSTQVWAVEVRDEEDRLICISRCTLAVKDIRPDE
jgi:uncharacterized protein (TIGR00369 family)